MKEGYSRAKASNFPRRGHTHQVGERKPKKKKNTESFNAFIPAVRKRRKKKSQRHLFRKIDQSQSGGVIPLIYTSLEKEKKGSEYRHIPYPKPSSHEFLLSENVSHIYGVILCIMRHVFFLFFFLLSFSLVCFSKNYFFLFLHSVAFGSNAQPPHRAILRRFQGTARKSKSKLTVRKISAWPQTSSVSSLRLASPSSFMKTLAITCGRRRQGITL